MWWSLFFLNKWFSIRHKQTDLNLIQNRYDDEKMFVNISLKKICNSVSY